MERINNKRSLGVAALGFIFLGAAVLPISYSFFRKLYTFISWQHFFIVIMPQIIIYSVCSLVVFKMWRKLSLWQKSVLIGIGIQTLLLLFLAIIFDLLIDRSLSLIVSRSLMTLDIILSPLTFLYSKIIISQRAIHNESGVSIITYHWESGLLFPLLRLIYGGTVGGLVGKLIALNKKRQLMSI